jgi:hypothetical protein
MTSNKTQPADGAADPSTTAEVEPTDLQAYVSRRVAPRRAFEVPVEPAWVQVDFEASWPLVLADTSVAS